MEEFLQERIFPLVEGVGDGDDRYPLACIAEHLGAGHHDDVVVGILGYSRLERRFIRISERLAEVHAHVCEVFYDYRVIQGREFSYGPEFFFGKVEPCRIVRAGVDHRGYPAAAQMLFELRAQLSAAIIIDIEGFAPDIEDMDLRPLHRKSRINEKDGVLLLGKVGAEKEGGEASLHGTHGRDAAVR